MAIIQSTTDTYDILDVLGKGTFGEVTKCWKRLSGEMVAVKILKDDAYRSRIIKNELKLLKALKEVDPEESHIIKFYESFHDEAKYYLIFELLEQNLFEYQKESNFNPLPVRYIRTITTQVLKALSRLKELSVIHADLKPENIMIVNHDRYPFRVKLIDFGSASLFNEVRYVKEPYIQSRFYRSPEILLGLPFCEKVDMWSLGCVMAELHLGWPLYPGNNEYDQIRYICETQGMPRNHLLNAASKATLFFKRKTHLHAIHHWHLKSVAEYEAETGIKPLERRKYILKSLDDIETVNITKTIFPDSETLPEFHDRKNMVELIKRMLTLDSHERINPNAALKHPFITMQQLRTTYQNTHYYRLSVESLEDALKHDKSMAEHRQFYHMPEDHYYPDPEYYANEKVHNIPSITTVQRTIDKMDDLSIEEPVRDNGMNIWGEGSEIGGYQSSASMEVSSICPVHSYLRGASYQPKRHYHHHHHHHGHKKEPIMAYYNGCRYDKKYPKPSRHSKSDPTFGNLILLGQQSPEGTPNWEDEETESTSSATSSSLQDSTGTEDKAATRELRISPTAEVRKCRSSHLNNHLIL